MCDELSVILTPEVLNQRAGFTYYQRGVSCYEYGSVRNVSRIKNAVVGSVSGTFIYEVSLFVRDGVLQGSCTCPLGENGVFCKHIVAVGLAYLYGEYEDKRPDNPFGFEDDEDVYAAYSTQQLALMEECLSEPLPSDAALHLEKLKEKISLLTELAENCDANSFFHYDLDEYLTVHEGSYRSEENMFRVFDRGFRRLKMEMSAIAAGNRRLLLFWVSEFALEKLLYGDFDGRSAYKSLRTMMFNHYIFAVQEECISRKHLLEKFNEWETQTKYDFFDDFFDNLFKCLPDEVKKMWYDWAYNTWSEANFGEDEKSPNSIYSNQEYMDKLENRLLFLALDYSDNIAMSLILHKKGILPAKQRKTDKNSGGK